MDLSAFANSPAGMLVPISGSRDPGTGSPFSHYAFVPNPLPTILGLDQSTWAQVVGASTALAKLDQAGRQIPDSALQRLRRPAIRREAQSTSALEGTHAAFEDLFEPQRQSAGLSESTTASITEVMNYVRAAELAFEWIHERPITLTMISQLQLELVKGTKGQLRDAGGIREQQVMIGPDGGSFPEARFVPAPPGDQLRQGVEAWLDWVNSPDPDVPPVVRAALAHYQFETLHPFSDGNGRMGRLLIVLQLIQDGALRDPLLIVSPWFERRRREYQDALLAVSQTGEISPWVKFFSAGLEAQAIATTQQVDELLAFQQELRDLVHSQPIRGTGARIAEDLIGEPIISANSAAARYGVSFQAANTGIATLVKAGILREITGRASDRFYASTRVLGIFSRER